MRDITTQSDFLLIEALWLHLATYIWVNIGSCTLTSWIIVYIRVFIWENFPTYTALFESIRLSEFHHSTLYGFYSSLYVLRPWKCEQRCEIPAENLVHEINWKQISPWLCGQLALILLKTHIFITKVTSPHGESNISSILVTISSTESCIQWRPFIARFIIANIL